MPVLTYMKKRLGILLILLGLGLGSITVGKVLYYPPNDDLEDPTIAPVNAQASVNSEGNEVIEEQKALPERLYIPKIGVDAAVQHVGLTKKGNMANPSNFTDVAWYKFGPVPGMLGSAVIAGHLDNALALNGVFKKLNELKVGDDVYVTSEDGEKLRFKVIESQIYPYDDAPEERIFNANDAKRLNLITCAGKWLKAEKTYDQRLVVYAELVE